MEYNGRGSGVTNGEMIKYANDPKNRDLRIVKVCDFCGAKYHPRKNSYRVLSRFCSAECSHKGIRGVMQKSYGRRTDSQSLGRRGKS